MNEVRAAQEVSLTSFFLVIHINLWISSSCLYMEQVLSLLSQQHPWLSSWWLCLPAFTSELKQQPSQGARGTKVPCFFQDLDPFEVKYKTAGVRGCLWSGPFVCLGRHLQYSTLKFFTSPHPLNSASPQNSSSFCFKSLTNFHRAKVFKISAEYC